MNQTKEGWDNEETGLSAFGIQDEKAYQDMYISQAKNETEKMERKFNIWLENRDDDFTLDIWNFRILQDFIKQECSLVRSEAEQRVAREFAKKLKEKVMNTPGDFYSRGALLESFLYDIDQVNHQYNI